jgi:Uma2 family endonuclease
MATAALTRYTPEEYLALERNAEFKSEFIDGRIVAMTGASIPHNAIVSSLHGALYSRLREGPCQLFVSDLRVQVADGQRYTYPDVVAVCEPPKTVDEVRDTLTNPALIVEVLSPSTEAYDRGEKFEHYRTIETLQEHVLVAQDRVSVERFARQGKFWVLATFTSLDEEVELTSVGCTIPLREIYEKVDLPLSTQVGMDDQTGA